ncbi:MAG: GNAT family N-acetyltransferase, partial [Methanospirillum sp.]|nr:GNAT family N-acetyltransferase [Methanospirillum sp.]
MSRSPGGIPLPELYSISKIRECDPTQMRALFAAGDWWEPEWDDSVLAGIVSCSFAFVVARDPADRWIGMGRLISDGVSDAYLQDIVVLPEWRGKGIRTAIVRTLLDICHESGITWI